MQNYILMKRQSLGSILVLICLFINPLFGQDEYTIYELYKSVYHEIGGYKINVETLGKGEPIFFLPGGPGNSHDYMQGNFGHYHNQKQLVFFDFLGRGKSEDARDKSEYSVDNDVEITEGVRKALGLDKISLVGHSYGTVVAQAYAIKYPDNVNKIVLINGFHSGEMWQANCDSYNQYAKTHFPELWQKVDSMRALGYISSDPAFSKLYGSFPMKYVYYHDTSLKQNVPDYEYRGWNPDVYYGIIGRDADFDVSGSMIDQDYRRKLKDIAAPTLVIAGRYDGVSTPEYAVQYKQFMSQAQFVMFENSGHNPYLEEKEKFFDLFEEFFEMGGMDIE
jgi:proline iminopeptidase